MGRPLLDPRTPRTFATAVVFGAALAEERGLAESAPAPTDFGAVLAEEARAVFAAPDVVRDFGAAGFGVRGIGILRSARGTCATENVAIACATNSIAHVSVRGEDAGATGGEPARP